MGRFPHLNSDRSAASMEMSKSSMNADRCQATQHRQGFSTEGRFGERHAAGTSSDSAPFPLHSPSR